MLDQDNVSMSLMSIKVKFQVHNSNLQVKFAQLAQLISKMFINLSYLIIDYVELAKFGILIQASALKQ